MYAAAAERSVGSSLVVVRFLVVIPEPPFRACVFHLLSWAPSSEGSPSAHTSIRMFRHLEEIMSSTYSGRKCSLCAIQKHRQCRTRRTG